MQDRFGGFRLKDKGEDMDMLTTIEEARSPKLIEARELLAALEAEMLREQLTQAELALGRKLRSDLTQAIEQLEERERSFQRYLAARAAEREADRVESLRRATLLVQALTQQAEEAQRTGSLAKEGLLWALLEGSEDDVGEAVGSVIYRTPEDPAPVKG